MTGHGLVGEPEGLPRDRVLTQQVDGPSKPNGNVGGAVQGRLGDIAVARQFGLDIEPGPLGEQPSGVAVGERPQRGLEVVRGQVWAPEPGHVGLEPGHVGRVPGLHERDLSGREAGGAQAPRPVLAHADVGVHGALPSVGEQPLPAVLQGEQAQLGVAVAAQLAQSRVVVAGEDRQVAVQRGDRETGLEEPVGVWAAGRVGQLVEQEHLDDTAVVTVPHRPTEQHALLVPVRHRLALALRVEPDLDLATGGRAPPHPRPAALRGLVVLGLGLLVATPGRRHQHDVDLGRDGEGQPQRGGGHRSGADCGDRGPIVVAVEPDPLVPDELGPVLHAVVLGRVDVGHRLLAVAPPWHQPAQQVALAGGGPRQDLLLRPVPRPEQVPFEQVLQACADVVRRVQGARHDCPPGQGDRSGEVGH